MSRGQVRLVQAAVALGAVATAITREPWPVIVALCVCGWALWRAAHDKRGRR